jgi:hypothetical protein
MPLLGFEPTITAFKRAKTIHAINRAATVIGTVHFTNQFTDFWANMYLVHGRKLYHTKIEDRNITPFMSISPFFQMPSSFRDN